MFVLRQTSVKMAVLLHKQAKVPYSFSVTVCVIPFSENSTQNETGWIEKLKIGVTVIYGRPLSSKQTAPLPVYEAKLPF